MGTVTGHFGSVAPGGRSVIWAATGRFGGVSQPPFAGLNLAGYVGDDPGHVQENLEIAAASIDLVAGALAIMQGVHGAKVAVVDRGGLVPGVDALVTTTPGVGLVALVADCVPVVLADIDAGVIAAVHCGWRGLSIGVVPAAVDQMRDLGATDIHAVVGPSICAACYPVPPERVAEVIATLPPLIADIACPVSEIPCIDVGAGVRAQLAGAGVSAVRIDKCTAQSPDLFSYRRDGLTGRQGMLIRLSTRASTGTMITA